VGESAWVYYNGTDYVKLSTTVASGVTSFTAGTTGLTPSTATTGAVTLAGTLATANGGTNLTSFTSGGVVYASSSSALATGSALTFNGTNFTVGYSSGSSRFNVSNNGVGGFEINPDGTGGGPALLAYNRITPAYLQMTFSALNQVFQISGTEGMRLTSTGLGIGTSSPAYKLQVYGTDPAIGIQANSGTSDVWTMQAVGADQRWRLVNNTSGFGEILTVTRAGNVLVGGTAARGTTVGAAHLDLFNGTAPAGTLTDGVSLYSSSGDLKFMNAAGDAFDVGYRNIPQNVQTGSYTLTLADAGDHIYRGSGSAATWTIPAASSVAYPIGTAITFINLSATAVSIAITTDTMYLSSAGTTGTRTLAQYGSATAIKISGVSSSGIWLISGSGLT
jgi:hypothetical protein